MTDQRWLPDPRGALAYAEDINGVAMIRIEFGDGTGAILHRELLRRECALEFYRQLGLVLGERRPASR